MYLNSSIKNNTILWLLGFTLVVSSFSNNEAQAYIDRADSSSSEESNEQVKHSRKETDLGSVARGIGVNLDKVLELLESPDEHKKLQALSLSFRMSIQIPCTDDAATWMFTRLLGELCFRAVKDEAFAKALGQAPEKTKQTVNQFLLLYWGAEDGPKLSGEEKQKYTKEIHENIKAKYPKVGALLEDISHPH